MNLLEKLAAWYLQQKIKGFVVDYDHVFEHAKGGWIFGDGWHITFTGTVHERHERYVR